MFAEPHKNKHNSPDTINKKLHICSDDILQQVRTQYKIDKCYNPDFLTKVANENNTSRQTIIKFIRNDTTITATELPTIPIKRNQPISNEERNRILKYLISRLKDDGTFEHGSIKDAAAKFYRSDFTIHKIIRLWEEAMRLKTDGHFTTHVGHLKDRFDDNVDADCQNIPNHTLKPHHYTRISDKERRDILFCFSELKRMQGNVTNSILKHIALHFNRSMRTIRKMALRFGLHICKEEDKTEKNSLLNKDDADDVSNSDFSQGESSEDDCDDQSNGSCSSDYCPTTTATLEASVPFNAKKKKRIQRDCLLRKKYYESSSSSSQEHSSDDEEESDDQSTSSSSSTLSTIKMTLQASVPFQSFPKKKNRIELNRIRKVIIKVGRTKKTCRILYHPIPTKVTLKVGRSSFIIRH